MDPTKPHPQRFQVYTLCSDGKGFTIKDCKFIFRFDRYGGWRDQHGHYYNSNGEPDFEPEDAELTPSEGSFHSDDDRNDYDEYQPNYDDYDDGYEDEHYNSWQLRNLEKIQKNKQTLSFYSSNKPLRVYFSNMPFKAPPKSVYEAYSQKVNGIINIIFDIQQNRRNGQGHFIMENAKAAEALIKLEGQKIIQRQVHFEVQKLDELLIDPIKQADFIPFWKNNKTFFSKTENAADKKDDIPRFKAAPVPQKVQQTKVTKQQKVDKKQQKPISQIVNKQKQQPVKPPVKVEVKNTDVPKADVKKQQKQPQFKAYRLNFQIFDTKTKFFNWIAERGLNKDTDIRNINKIEKEGKTIITMQVKTALLDKLNGKLYNGKQVVFTAL